MKTLIDDTEVSARGYYYLLDWNDQDEWKTIQALFGTCKLCELEKHQYIQLFEVATRVDLKRLNEL